VSQDTKFTNKPSLQQDNKPASEEECGVKEDTKFTNKPSLQQDNKPASEEECAVKEDTKFTNKPSLQQDNKPASEEDCAVSQDTKSTNKLPQAKDGNVNMREKESESYFFVISFNSPGQSYGIWETKTFIDAVKNKSFPFWMISEPKALYMVEILEQRIESASKNTSAAAGARVVEEDKPIPTESDITHSDSPERIKESQGQSDSLKEEQKIETAAAVVGVEKL
jgi:hypothetical protein